MSAGSENENVQLPWWWKGWVPFSLLSVWTFQYLSATTHARVLSNRSYAKKYCSSPQDPSDNWLFEIHSTLDGNWGLSWPWRSLIRATHAVSYGDTVIRPSSIEPNIFLMWSTDESISLLLEASWISWKVLTCYKSIFMHMYVLLL